MSQNIGTYQKGQDVTGSPRTGHVDEQVVDFSTRMDTLETPLRMKQRSESQLSQSLNDIEPDMNDLVTEVQVSIPNEEILPTEAEETLSSPFGLNQVKEDRDDQNFPLVASSRTENKDLKVPYPTKHGHKVTPYHESSVISYFRLHIIFFIFSFFCKKCEISFFFYKHFTNSKAAIATYICIYMYMYVLLFFNFFKKKKATKKTGVINSNSAPNIGNNTSDIINVQSGNMSSRLSEISIGRVSNVSARLRRNHDMEDSMDTSFSQSHSRNNTNPTKTGTMAPSGIGIGMSTNVNDSTSLAMSMTHSDNPMMAAPGGMDMLPLDRERTTEDEEDDDEERTATEEETDDANTEAHKQKSQSIQRGAEMIKEDEENEYTDEQTNQLLNSANGGMRSKQGSFVSQG
ncbi:hypothetical protein RFI_16443 [Reticulomyxa filosa]|uniref:Uncharacterized protein n=1 Tax=Reticulomyxa filosa TaxID=46433 RepID=X6N4T5_RETFI|nr:hypothetical protein RFI_16443 [Reticulomyxa filosa]|eukprot:ETO20774.1 hypothetical protein RFI_16443 [Reticulomyxa filosa]